MNVIVLHNDALLFNHHGFMQVLLHILLRLTYLSNELTQVLSLVYHQHLLWVHSILKKGLFSSLDVVDITNYFTVYHFLLYYFDSLSSSSLVFHPIFHSFHVGYDADFDLFVVDDWLIKFNPFFKFFVGFDLVEEGGVHWAFQAANHFFSFFNFVVDPENIGSRIALVLCGQFNFS